jgi:hypothetical protein
MADVLVYNYVSRDAQVALEEFKQDFLSAFMFDPSQQWAEEVGLTIQTDVLKVTLPIPISAAQYVQRRGDRVYRRLSEKHFTFSPAVWTDGFAENAEIVEAPDFIGWQQEPANMASAAANLRNKLIADLIESNTFTGPTMTGFDDLSFFIASGTKHPYNILDPSLGGFYNKFTGATLLTPENIGLARQRFAQLKAPNGIDPLGVEFAGVLVPPALEETMKRIAQQDLVPWTGVISTTSASSQPFGAVNNIYKGTDYWVGRHLTDDVKWYAIGRKKGMYPWAIVNKGAPQIYVQDKTSALFSTTGQVGLFAELQTTGAMCFPHLVQAYAGTSS